MNIHPAENEVNFIRESLNRFNKEIVGDDGHAPLNEVLGILPDIPGGHQKYLLMKTL